MDASVNSRGVRRRCRRGCNQRDFIVLFSWEIQVKIWVLISCLVFVAFGCRTKPVVADIPAFPAADFQYRDGVFGSERFRFRVYVPKDRLRNAKLPVMLYLHGADDRGDDNERQLSGLANTITTSSPNFPFIIVFPQCASGRFWDSGMIDQAMKAVDQTVKEFDGDENRLYLSGFSLGG